MVWRLTSNDIIWLQGCGFKFQRAHNVETSPYWRICEVITLHQRQYDVTTSLPAGMERLRNRNREKSFSAF